MRTIVHLSDLHFGRADPAVVEACGRAIDELAPDLVAISGDLTQRARRREFAAAARFIERLRAPVIATLGNHDLPLYNGLLRALAPRRGFRRSIGSRTATSFADAQLSAIAIDSTRAWRWKSGGVTRRELEKASAQFGRRSAGALAVLVVHHPVDDEMLAGRLAATGAELCLTGHLHRSHPGAVTAGSRLLSVRAGTVSTRRRGEEHAFNALVWDGERVTVTTRVWDGRGFEAGAQAVARRDAGGWRLLGPTPHA